MIESVLIANRGEIARRIIRTARRLGLRTIAVFSEADTKAPFVREADEAFCVGPPPARQSYLAQGEILAVAKASGAAAIHPGYGFLSENADFAEATERAGIVWVGAPPSAIRAMGAKDAAKRLMMESGVPVTPGYLGEDQSDARLKQEAKAIGYPVLIKAVAGGGGKGMRKVEEAAAFKDALQSCRREASAAFGDDRVLIEKYVASPRHLEVQVFGDRHGAIVHLYERDCSLQRRHQKVIEEAPAPGLDPDVRESMCAAAVKAAKAVGYVGAGTVEFIADASEGLRADRIWFMEMNTRLQVEHAVTEAITGLDLVEWQIRVASGEALPLRQEDIRCDGWAMEARLYAENPAADFLPSIGTLAHMRLPETARVDAGVEEGDEVTPYYDPMIAKLIVHASDRKTAAQRLAAACEAVEVWPVRTNAGFLARCARSEDFLVGAIDTGFIGRRPGLLVSGDPPEAAVRAAARALVSAHPLDPWTALTGFRCNAQPDERIWVKVGTDNFLVAPDWAPTARVAQIGAQQVVFFQGEAWQFSAPQEQHALDEGAEADGAIRAPMPGRVVAVEAFAGQSVRKGQRLVVLEAMKMEHVLLAPVAGSFAPRCSVGGQVSEGDILARIEREEP